MINYSTKKSILTLTFIYVILMIIFAFYDLNISISLLNYESIFGRIGQSLAEVPMDFLTMFSYALIFNTRRKKDILNYFLKFISFIGTFEYGFFMIYYVFKFAEFDNSLIIGMVGGVIFGIISLFLSKKIINNHEKEYLRIATIIILSVLFEELFVNIIKIIINRPRFKDLTSYAEFVPWYKIRSSSISGDSFPSGHTARAAGIIFIILFSNTKDKRIIYTIISFLWILFIALGRIILGAHFASDVISGAYIMLLSFLFVRYFYDKRGIKNE